MIQLLSMFVWGGFVGFCAGAVFMAWPRRGRRP